MELEGVLSGVSGVDGAGGVSGVDGVALAYDHSTRGGRQEVPPWNKRHTKTISGPSEGGMWRGLERSRVEWSEV